jgi:hypothetical protein
MDNKTKLINLVRIACLHKLQGNFVKAQDAFNSAKLVWQGSDDLNCNDWSDASFEYYTCYYHPERSLRSLNHVSC